MGLTPAQIKAAREERKVAPPSAPPTKPWWGTHSAKDTGGGNDPNSALSMIRGAVSEGGTVLDAVGQFAYDMSLAPGARRGEESDLIPNAGQQAADATGIPAAEGRAGKSFERSGEYMVDALLTAPVIMASAPAIGVSPVLAVLAEMGFAGLGGFASSELEQDGNPGMGLAAAAALGVPATAGGRAAQKSVSGVKNVVKTINQMTRKALPYMDELQVSRGSLVRGSSEIKRRVADVDAFITALKKGEKVNKNSPGGVSTRQVADAMENDRGGPHFGAMEERISRDSIEYGTKRALRRADFLDYLAREWETLGGDEAGDFVEFLARYDEGAGILKTSERQAWRVVRDGEQPQFDMTSVQRYVTDTVGKAKLTDDKAAIPAIFKDLLDVEKFPGGDGMVATKWNLNDFQDARSNMLEIVREAKMNPTRANRRASSFVIPVLNRMQKQINKWDKLDETGRSLEYLTAKNLTRENKMLYDLDAPTIRVLDQGGAEKGLFTAMRNAKGKKGKRFNGTSEAQRLMRIAEQTPDGVANLRRMAVDDLFRNTQGFVATGAKTPLKTLEQNSGAYRVILGKDYDRAVELLEMSKLGTRGAAGTANQAMRTGSGISPAQFLFGLARESVSPTPGVGVAGTVFKMMKESGVSKDEMMQLRIMVKALEDPKFMRILMEMPTEAALPAWIVSWGKLLASSGKAGARSGARSAVNEGMGN